MSDTERNDAERIAARITGQQHVAYGFYLLRMNGGPDYQDISAEAEAYIRGLAGERPACACCCLDVLRKAEAIHRKLAGQWAESEAGMTEDIVAMAMALVRRELGDTAALPQRGEAEAE